MDMTIVESAMGIIFLALVVLVAILYIKKKYNDKKILNEFFDGISSTLTKTILETLKESKNNQYKSFNEFEEAILGNIYHSTFKYLKSKAEKEFEKDSVMKVVVDNITEDKVKAVVDKIIDSIDGIEILKYNYVEEITPVMEKEDKALQEKFSNQEEYVEDSETVNEEELDHVYTGEEPTEEDLEQLNPQRDEEEEYNEEDSSIEVIKEPQSIITTSTDKNGNTLYYEMIGNKKKRVSKEYAITKLAENQ